MKYALLMTAALLIGSGNAPGADPILIGHRGLLRHAPENTLPAFSACLERHMGFELDIRTSQDGCLIVLHDDTLGRTTDGPDLSPRNLALTELKRLDAGSWFDRRFAAARIPTLAETLSLVKRQKRGPTIIALNVKDIDHRGEATLVSLVRKYGLLDESFAFDQSHECSRRLKSLEPRFRIGQNVGRHDLQSRLDEGSLDVFLLSFVPSREEVKILHMRGKQVLFNYSGSGDAYQDPNAWRLARKAGVDGMLTDYPLECTRLWQEEEKRGPPECSSFQAEP